MKREIRNQKIVEALKELIAEGVEYPDAEFRVAQKYKVAGSVVMGLYDEDQCKEYADQTRAEINAGTR